MQLVWSATCLHWRRQWLNSSEREGTSLELIHLLPTTGEMNNYCGANNKCYSFTQYKSNMESVFKKCTHNLSRKTSDQLASYNERVIISLTLFLLTWFNFPAQPLQFLLQTTKPSPHSIWDSKKIFTADLSASRSPLARYLSGLPVT